MRILWVATKAPWPLVDGGRVVLYYALKALAARGVEVTLVAPCDREFNRERVALELDKICHPILVSRQRRPKIVSLARAFIKGSPFSIEHHRNRALSAEVSRLLSREKFDIIHAEQLQAVANCPRDSAIPIVLCAQNVESDRDLWQARAYYRPALRPILVREAGRLRKCEAEAVRRSDATFAITERDAARLEEMANQSGRVTWVPAQFPARLDAGTSRLSGDPALVMFGTSGWVPNADGMRWFMRAIWPTVSSRAPRAVLHLFTAIPIRAGSPNAVVHAAPRDSVEVFGVNSILLVPMRIASGVRIKILEAWARGIPVIATPAAAEGLGATDGQELIIARDGHEFAVAIARLHQDPELREAILERARSRLRTVHDPDMIAGQMIALCERVIAARRLA
jgi:glycosyltransferase involved in cell wall biosynthesis